MLNVAVFDVIAENLKHLTEHCSGCSKHEECEETPALGDNDYEPRYCKSIIEAAVMDGVCFKVPFPKGDVSSKSERRRVR